jgi:WD40 repeat protein
MLRWLAFFGAVAVVAVGVVFYLNNGAPPTWLTPPPVGKPKSDAPAEVNAKAPAEVNNKAPAAADVKVAEAQERPPAPPVGPWPREVGVAPRVVIPGARLSPVELLQLPARDEGQLLFLATEIDLKPGETPPAGAFKYPLPYLVTEAEPRPGTTPGPDWAVIDGKWYRPLTKDDEVRPHKVRLHRPPNRWFMPLDEGTKVKDGQILGLIDPALYVDELTSKLAKLDAAEADRDAEVKQRDEYYQRWQRAESLYKKGAGALEDATAARLAYDYHVFETLHKNEDIKVAATELRQAETKLEQMVIRSKIDGQVKQLLHRRGEYVKKLEPAVMELQDHSKLRIRGRVDLQDMDVLREPGAVLDVEATRSVGPRRVLTGHMGEVTGVAVSKDNQIVSVSDDRTARVWQKDLKQRRERLVLDHPAAVRAVACTPETAEKNLCLTGAADGVARLYDLAAEGNPFVRQFRDANGHKEGGINCVAFSPNGRWAVTGGDDRAVCLWDVDSGALLQRFPKDLGHHGGVTSVAFLPAGPNSQLSVVSAGRDNALLLWPLAADGAPEKERVRRLERRGGEVTALGVNPKGGQLLFDQGKELRLLSSVNGALVGSLSATGGATFSRLALFSPDGKLVLASGGGSRLGLWRAPTAETRGHEVEHLVWTSGRDEQAMTTSGAFAPDGSFLVTGTHNRNVIVWPMPDKDVVERRLTARLINLDPEVSSGQVRLTAELDNPNSYLLPGDVVTLVVYPEK